MPIYVTVQNDHLITHIGYSFSPLRDFFRPLYDYGDPCVILCEQTVPNTYEQRIH